MTFKLITCPKINAYCSLYRLDGMCAYPGGECKPVVEECGSCRFIINDRCRIYPNPAAKWRRARGCPRRHIIGEWEKRKYVKNIQARKNDTTEAQSTSIKQKEKRQETKKFTETKKVGRFRNLVKNWLKI